MHKNVLANFPEIPTLTKEQAAKYPFIKSYWSVRNLKGFKFGKLTPKYITGRNLLGNIIWYCECDCGNHLDISSKDLLTDRIHSCGCTDEKMFKLEKKSRRQEKLKRRKENLSDIRIDRLKKLYVGKQFGNVTVLDLDRIRENKRGSIGNSYWKCKCNCGNEKDVIFSASRLKKGNCKCKECKEKEKKEMSKKWYKNWYENGGREYRAKKYQERKLKKNMEKG